MQAEECPHGHPIRSAADRLPNGYCRQCQRDQNRRQRDKQRMKLQAAQALVETLTKHGVIVDPDTLELKHAPGQSRTAPEAAADELVRRCGEGVD